MLTWKKSTGFKTYKRDNKKRGIVAGVPVEQFKTEIFNPNSRDHIADRLKTLGWKPKHLQQQENLKLMRRF